jgi:hypothetical protein
MFWNDQVETLAERLLRGKAKHAGRSAIPPDNFARTVCVDDGIGELIENFLSQELVFQGWSYLNQQYRMRFPESGTGRDSGTRGRKLAPAGKPLYCVPRN